MNKRNQTSSTSGFTIVELLIVIVIIGILATIVIVAYNGVTAKARQVTLQSDLTNSRTKIELTNATDGQYPSSSTVSTNKANYLAESKGNTLAYSANPDGSAYCINAVGSDGIVYVLSNLIGPVKGSCTGDYDEVAVEGTGVPTPSAAIQTITTTSCPTNRTRVKDARDNHTYWIKKLADGKCWMLTNLAYSGGGDNTYGDTKPLTDNSGGSVSYTDAQYYVVPETTNFTIEPADPSTSADGIGQYGYMYNWCAAMGGQNTSACANNTTPAPDPAISICPAGWRLPTGNGGEFGNLNTAINAGSTTDDSGLLGTPWFGQLSGSWGSTPFYFYERDETGYYWSSSWFSANVAYAVMFYEDYANFAYYNSKVNGQAVRCIAAT